MGGEVHQNVSAFGRTPPSQRGCSVEANYPAPSSTTKTPLKVGVRAIRYHFPLLPRAVTMHPKSRQLPSCMQHAPPSHGVYQTLGCAQREKLHGHGAAPTQAAREDRWPRKTFATPADRSAPLFLSGGDDYKRAGQRSIFSSTPHNAAHRAQFICLAGLCSGRRGRCLLRVCAHGAHARRGRIKRTPGPAISASGAQVKSSRRSQRSQSASARVFPQLQLMGAASKQTRLLHKDD